MQSGVLERIPSARKPIRRVDDRESLTSDLVSQYLTGISKYDLLTAEGEVELAQRIEAGRDAARELDEKKPRRNTKARTSLERKVRKGQEAKEDFLTANLRQSNLSTARISPRLPS